MIMEGGFVTAGALVLASASPRRQRFLRELGLQFTVQPAAVDEIIKSGESPKDFVLRLAGEKALVVSRDNTAACVLAADTVVVFDGEILGKPADNADAMVMLGKLSGSWHEVWTGYCLYSPSCNQLVKRAVKTDVLFRPLTEELCRAYVLTGEPLDKAGSYGLQGRGGFLVEKIDGSYSNVIGLPMAQVVEDMLEVGVILPVTSLE